MTAETIPGLGKPEVLKLQQVNQGLKVGRVFGRRVLVSPIGPRTYMDALEREGTLLVPQHLKRIYTPAPSTGIVVKLGDGVTPDDGVYEGQMVMFSKYAGTQFVVDGDERDEDKGSRYKLLDVNDIACELVPTGENVVALVPDADEPDVPVKAGEALIK